MKVALLSYLVGSLLIIVYSAETRPKCGCNMEPTPCFPCNQVCNEPPRACPLYCLVNATNCICKPGFKLPRSNSKFCIPEGRCPRKPTCQDASVG